MSDIRETENHQNGSEMNPGSEEQALNKEEPVFDASETEASEGQSGDIENNAQTEPRKTRDDELFRKRQAKRKRKHLVWSAVKLIISGIICIPLIFFCFWTGVKLFFPLSTQITGVKEKIIANANKDLNVSLTVTNPEDRPVELQFYDDELEVWETKKSYETGSEDKEELKITFPDEWKKHTHSKWRFRIDRSFGVKKYTGEPINVLARNRGGVKIKCSAAVIYCKDDDEVLYNINMNKKLPNASTTKMMTAILALEKGNMEDVVTFSRRAAITPYAYMGIRDGYKFKMDDLMKAMLIMSANECATAIGEHVGGTYEDFRDMMNKRAKELGCKHTHFVTPSGLDTYGHHSTAYDIAMINSKAIEFDEYNKIMLMEHFTLRNLNKDEEWEFEIKPTNDLLKEHIKGYMGGKTGTTAQAGNCLSSAYKWKGNTYIITVFNTYDRFAATKTLMKYVRKYA